MKPSIFSHGTLAFLLMGSLAWHLGCGKPDPGHSDGGAAGRENVLAVYDDGQITADELDAHILATEGARALPKDGSVDWVEDLLREMALERLLLARKEQTDLQAPDLENRARELRRQVISARFLQENLSGLEPPSEQEIREAYEKDKQRFQREHQILVRNMFRRRNPETKVETLVAELENVREQLINGASFAELAKKHSDSQSRHFSGTLGWLTRESLPPQLADVLFQLEVGVPSEPIVAAQGVHLFLVQDEQRATDYPFEDVRQVLSRELAARARQQALTALLADLPLPDGLWRPEPEAAAAMLQGDDPDAVIFRAGDYEVRVADLPRLSLQVERSERTGDLDGLMRMLERRERIYAHCQTAGCFDEAEIEREVALTRDRMTAALVRQAELEKRIDEERLRAHYEDHKQRFSQELLLQVMQLEIEKTERQDPNRVMALLEELHARERVEVEDLEVLAEQFGGNLQELGWVDFSKLGAVYKGSLGPVLRLLPGTTAPPLFVENYFRMLLVTGRREPEALPFEEIRPRVVRSFLVSHGQELNHRLETELLEEKHFQLRARALDAFLRKLSGNI